MVSVLIFIAAFTLFAFSSRGLIVALTENVGMMGVISTDYSRRALRLGKGYKIFAWSILTLFLFINAVQSFLIVFFAF